MAVSKVRVAAVQASYVLMDQRATLERVAELSAKAAEQGAQLVVFPEVFVPGTPIWIDTRPIWDGDDDWYRLLVDNAVVIPGPAPARLADIASEHSIWLVIGVEERDAHGATIYNTVLYFSPEGQLVEKHRKLEPTGAERTVWGMGDGATLRVVPTPFARVGGLICWENYMPLARFHLYAQGIDIWVAPTLAVGDGWIATLRHIAPREHDVRRWGEPGPACRATSDRFPRSRQTRERRLPSRTRRLARAGQYRHRRTDWRHH